MSDIPAQSGPDSERTAQFLQLYSVNQPRLFSYILAMIPAWQDAEEVLQEASIVLWQSFDQFEPGTNFWAWSKKVALNQVFTYRKRAKRLPIPISDSFITAVTEEYSDQADDLDSELEVLAECVEKLTPNERELISACYEPEVTIRQAASRLGRPEGTVYKSLTRIRRSLLKCIERTISEGGRR